MSEAWVFRSPVADDILPGLTAASFRFLNLDHLIA